MKRNDSCLDPKDGHEHAQPGYKQPGHFPGLPHTLPFICWRQVTTPSLTGSQTTEPQSRESVLPVKRVPISEPRFHFLEPSLVPRLLLDFVLLIILESIE